MKILVIGWQRIRRGKQLPFLVFMGKINSRNKGHAFERYVAKLFREAGYSCTTSRFSSKEQDALGVDLCGTGDWQVQCKAVEKLGSLHDILAKMPNNSKINTVFHKRSKRGTIVAMIEKDFLKLLKLLLDCGIIKP